MFKEYPNTLIYETLLPDNMTEREIKEIGYIKTIDPRLTSSLSMISSYYLYTGTPPHGYGTQAPKVAETVRRAYKFNKKADNKEIIIAGRKVERMHWEKADGKFPFGEVHGNFIVSEQVIMIRAFLRSYHMLVDTVVEKVMRAILNENSDVLTKGRQTFCPFTNQSVTSSVAYKRAFDFLTTNCGEVGMGCLDWIKATVECFEKDTLIVTETYQEKREKRCFDKATSQFTLKEVVTTKTRVVTIEGREKCQQKMMDLVTRFASYIKHKERGKKDRRAIASAGMFLRMFLHIIELFHLELAKELPGSTISIGGEEKKAKITQNLSNTSLENQPANCVIQGTEDATKWNECLAPSCFAVMHRFLFDFTTRTSTLSAPASELGNLFSKIAVTGNFFMALKEIQLGSGLLVENGDSYKRVDWSNEEELNRALNPNTKEWYNDIKHLLSEDGKFLRSSPGMLMGMLNAGSTTLGLLPVNHRFNKDLMKMVTLRSSDDSMSVYLSSSLDGLRACVEMGKRNLALLGINLSPDKTLFFKEGYGEYTSWYMDGGFVSQFGVETASIRPQGKNPPDDFYSIAKGTSTALSTLNMNPIGASARLRLGIDGVRRLWRIEYLPGKRQGISGRVQLLSDGGESPWDCMNSHLDEIPLKERLVTTEEEKAYFLRVMNPENPFSPPIEEEVAFSKEHGCLQVTEVEAPRTAFHFMKRTNRTFKKDEKRASAKKEKDFAAAVEAVKLIDPSVCISYPKTSVTISRHLHSIMMTLKEGVEFTPEEEVEISKALYSLQNGKEEQDDSSADEISEDSD